MIEAEYADCAVHRGDCMEVMASIPANSIDAIVTDPPYGLGFMGKAWDDLPPGLEWAQECLRVLKPGGHLLAFGGTRTWHRLAVSVEDAGFEIRDSIAWMYGTGFPKGNSQMKPAFEPCVMGRKPFTGSMSANVAKHGTGTLQIDACRIECESRPVMVRTATQVAASSMSGVSTGATSNGEMTDTGRWPANVCLDDNMATVLDQQSGVTKSSAAHNKTVSMASGRTTGQRAAMRTKAARHDSSTSPKHQPKSGRKLTASHTQPSNHSHSCAGW